MESQNPIESNQADASGTAIPDTSASQLESNGNPGETKPFNNIEAFPKWMRDIGAGTPGGILPSAELMEQPNPEGLDFPGQHVPEQPIVERIVTSEAQTEQLVPEHEIPEPPGLETVVAKEDVPEQPMPDQTFTQPPEGTAALKEETPIVPQDFSMEIPAWLNLPEENLAESPVISAQEPNPIQPEALAGESLGVSMAEALASTVNQPVHETPPEEHKLDLGPDQLAEIEPEQALTDTQPISHAAEETVPAHLEPTIMEGAASTSSTGLPGEEKAISAEEELPYWLSSLENRQAPVEIPPGDKGLPEWLTETFGEGVETPGSITAESSQEGFKEGGTTPRTPMETQPGAKPSPMDTPSGDDEIFPGWMREMGGGGVKESLEQSKSVQPIPEQPFLDRVVPKEAVVEQPVPGQTSSEPPSLEPIVPSEEVPGRQVPDQSKQKPLVWEPTIASEAAPVIGQAIRAEEIAKQSIVEPPIPEQAVSSLVIPEPLAFEPQTPEQPIQEQAVPTDEIAEQPTSELPIPEQAAPTFVIPEPPVFEAPIPDQPIQEQVVPLDEFAEQPVSEPPIPEQVAPAEEISETSAFEAPVPEQPILEQAVPAEEFAEQPVSGPPIPEQVAPAVEIPEPPAFEPAVPEQAIQEQMTSAAEVAGEPVLEQRIPEQVVPVVEIPEQTTSEPPVPEQPIQEQAISAKEVIEQPISEPPIPEKIALAIEIPEPSAYEPPAPEQSYQEQVFPTEEIPEEPVSEPHISDQVAPTLIISQPLAFEPAIPEQPIQEQTIPAEEVVELPVSEPPIPERIVSTVEIPESAASEHLVPEQSIQKQTISAEEIAEEPVSEPPIPERPIQEQVVPTEEVVETLPGWLKGLESHLAPAEAPKSTDDMPEWLRHPIPAEEIEPDLGLEQPTWVDENITDDQAEPTLPDEWIPVEGAQEDEPEQPSIQESRLGDTSLPGVEPASDVETDFVPTIGSAKENKQEAEPGASSESPQVAETTSTIESPTISETTPISEIETVSEPESPAGSFDAEEEKTYEPQQFVENPPTQVPELISETETGIPIEPAPESIAVSEPESPTVQSLHVPEAAEHAGVIPSVQLEDKDAELLSSAREALSQNSLDDSMKSYMRIIRRGHLINDVIHDLRAAIHHFPLNVNIWQTLGDAYMRANRLQDALDAYSKAEELLR